ncbi:hypothetical protein GCM10009839_13790 [Catenulispora yoronensis]|uniref:Cysteine dioxygenase n=1 Tax=Catenulispora yoronensis TaxID=450799 RepID=A0ABP5F9C1_9ACTN
MLDSIVAPLRDIDWNNIETVHAAATDALNALDTPGLLGKAVEDITNRPELRALCEHYDILDKLVLHDDPTGVRIRLHIFGPGHFDRPHNHRWSYASRILAGSYQHFQFGNVEVDENQKPAALRTLHCRTESAGDTYTLHHTMVHAVTAEADTVSLIVRGPAVKDRFLVMDRNAGTAWWQYGAAQESPEDAAAKRMTKDRLQQRISNLRVWGLT